MAPSTLAQPPLISTSALGALYDLSSEKTLQVVGPARVATRRLTFAARCSVGDAADKASKEMGAYLSKPTFRDCEGQVHRRSSSMVSMIDCETVELVNME